MIIKINAPHCTGPCSQGDGGCPTPQACQLGEPLTWRVLWQDFPVPRRVAIVVIAVAGATLLTLRACAVLQ